MSDQPVNQPVTQPAGAWRLRLVWICLALAAAAIIWKLFSLQLVDGEFLQTEGDARTLRVEP
jgi:cell division protein FtsI (penicillin-binding protein 3)